MITFILLVAAVVVGALLMTAFIAGAVTVASSGFVAVVALVRRHTDRSATPTGPGTSPSVYLSEAVGPPGPHWAG